MIYRRTVFIIIRSAFAVTSLVIIALEKGSELWPVLLFAYLAITAAIAYWQSVKVNDETIHISGFVPPKKPEMWNQLSAIRYKRLASQGSAGFDAFLFELRFDTGQTIRLHRYGWRRDHRQVLFAYVTRACDHNNVSADPATRRILKLVSKRSD